MAVLVLWSNIEGEVAVRGGLMVTKYRMINHVGPERHKTPQRLGFPGCCISPANGDLTEFRPKYCRP